MKIRILIADDHQMVRELLCHVLQAQSDWEVVAQTGDGLQVVPLIQATLPHVVCMDINLPGMNGIELTRSILQQWPHIKVVALSCRRRLNIEPPCRLKFEPGRVADLGMGNCG